WTGDPLADSHRIAREAQPVCVPPGTAIIFDRCLVHSASKNISTVTRKALFYGYAYRWVQPMYDQHTIWRRSGKDAIRRQLLGHGSAYRRFFPRSRDVPLRGWLEQREEDTVT